MNNKIIIIKKEKLLISRIVKRREAIMIEDIKHERQFAGSIDKIIIDMNSLTVNNLPLFLSEEGDPNHDKHIGTPAYIIGVILKNSRYIEHVRKWAEYNDFAFSHINDKIPETEPRSSVIVSNNPLLDVSINNWIEHKVMQLGDSELQLSVEESDTLKSILDKKYVVISIEDWESKCSKGLWPSLLTMMQEMVNMSTL